MGETSQYRRVRTKKTRGKPRTELKISESELLAELKAGKSSRELAVKYGVSPGTIRNRLREYDKKTYISVARQRNSPKSNGQREQLPVSDSELHERWKDGESTRDLAKKYNVSRQTITRRLKEYNPEEYNETARNKIAKSIAERRKKIPALPSELLNQFIKGESTAALAKKYNVSRQTMERVLLKHDRDLYKRTVNDRI